MSEKKKDLTRIEDLSEFLHEDDPDVDKLLEEDENSQQDNEQDDQEQLPSLDDLEDEPAPPDLENIQEFREHEQDDDPTNPGLGTSELESEFDEQSSEAPDWGAPEEQDWSSPEQEDQWPEQPDEDGPVFEESTLPEQNWDSDETGLDSFDHEELPGAEPESESEPEPEPEPEPQPEPEPEPEPEPRAKRPAPEKFDDIKQFAQTMSYGHVGAGGNPPFSVMLKNIKYQEDAEEILSLLKEHQIIDDQNLNSYQHSIDNGALLISQISEYSAIYLAHRLRRFDLDVMVGLADEIHPSKSYETTHKGLVSKYGLRQNKEETVSFKQAPTGPDQILVSTTPGLEGHRIHKYLGIITEHSLLKESDLEEIQHAPQTHEPFALEKEISEVQERLKHSGEIDEDDDELVSKYALSIQQIYGELVERLKSEAIKLKSNAVVGISFHLTPLIDKKEGELENMYKVTCTANAVWVSAQGEAE